MGGADLSDADAIWHAGASHATMRDIGQQLAGSGLALAVAFFVGFLGGVRGLGGGVAGRPASLARSSASALRSLRGTRVPGCYPVSRLATPAASRKRITRSVGVRALRHPGPSPCRGRDRRRSVVVLRQQRIEVAETLDEAAVARRAGVGDDDVIEPDASWCRRGRDESSGTL